jgi:hypothetical protein
VYTGTAPLVIFMVAVRADVAKSGSRSWATKSSDAIDKAGLLDLNYRTPHDALCPCRLGYPRAVRVRRPPATPPHPQASRA